MRHLLMILTAAACCSVTTLSLAATATNLNGEIQTLAIGIRKALKEHPLIIGRRLALEEIRGSGEARHSNFGLSLETLLKQELADSLDATSRLTLAGTYHYVSSDDPGLAKAMVIRVTLQIQEVGKQIVAVTSDINDTDDIRKILGQTGTGPQNPKASFQERNAAAKADQEQPTFDLQGQTRVSAKGAPQWSMGILMKTTFNGSTSPVAPQNVNGLAFTPIGPGDYYEIELVNHDKSDAVASLTVDGLEVANIFSVDRQADGKPIHWPGYFVKAGERIVIRGWQHTINPQAKDNVFAFRVVELGQGAASALKGRGSVGVITVQFREACPPGEKLSGRSFGETAKGEGLQEKQAAKEVQIGANVLSTISIRYNRPR